MKNVLATLFCLFVLLELQGQERYLDSVFAEVNVQKDIEYGINYSALTFPILGTFSKEELLMDFYEPAGDTLLERPLVFITHTGNFLPSPTNGGVYDSKDSDSTSIELAVRLAKMGYAVANLDYRLGWNPLDPDQSDRISTLINAAYRGMQDFRTAIRFMRMNQTENPELYRIDTSRITGWGIGTGSYIVLAAATIDSYEEIFMNSKFVTLDEENNPVPMIIESVHGDIYGTQYGVNPLTGDTISLPNHVGYSSDFHLSVNSGGALGDTAWLDGGDGPFISFHVPTDPFGPYKEFVLSVPLNDEILPVIEVQGSYLVDSLANEYGNNQVFRNLNLDDEITQVAEARRGDISGLLPLIGSGGVNDSAPWQWWDPTIENGEVGLQTNPDMSEEKAKIYIDSMIQFFAPRAYAALDLMATGISDNLKVETGLKVYPTVISQGCFVETDFEYPIRDIEVINSMGQKVFRIKDVNGNRKYVDLTALSPGMYFVRILTTDGYDVTPIIRQ